MSIYAVKIFLKELGDLKHCGGTIKEIAISFAFQKLLDEYAKAKDPTIAEKFNTYKFADYKEKVIDLLKRVCTVSVETMKIINEMPE